MAMLSVCDRIVFQAIGNVIASRARPLLATVVNKQSFANVLTTASQKAFFVHWKQQYRLFQEKFTELVEEGNNWLAETDVAAFYEALDHTHLFKILVQHELLDEATTESLQRYLSVWSAIRPETYSQRGVPQGCLTSDLLANIYLYPFDQELAVKEYYYLRYVDDLRLLAPTKEAVMRGLIHVDTALKACSLLLQTKKTVVRCIDDVDKESDRLAAQLSEIDSRLRDPDEYVQRQIDDPLAKVKVVNIIHIQDDAELEEPVDTGDGSQNLLNALVGDARDEFVAALEEAYEDVLQLVQQELETLFWSSFRSMVANDGDQYAERHVRFALYRLQPVPSITQAILPFFLDKPRIAEVLSVYLRKGELEQETVEYLQQKVIAEHTVYDTAISMAIRILHQKNISLRRHQAQLRTWLQNDQRDWPLLEASAMALGESSDNLSVLLAGLRSHSAMVRRMALIQSLRLAEDKETAAHIAAKAICDRSPDVIHTLLYLIYAEWGLSLGDLESSEKPASDYCRRVASGYDSSLPIIHPDYIRHEFTVSYHVNCIDGLDFRALLGSEYEHVSNFLWQAESSFLTNPSRYVSQLDLFHEELTSAIMVDKLQIKSSRHELAQVEWSNRIDMLQKNKEELRTYAGAIAACRRLRANPETHARFHREVKYTSPISWRQRDNLKAMLRGGYQELVNWIEAGCP
jgi:hypothetical protein